MALSQADGKQLWAYQATEVNTTVFGSPAPAYSAGIVIAGFGSGEIAAVRAETGAIIWTDGLGIVEGKATLVDFLAIRGEPVISNGQVYVTGSVGLTIAADLLDRSTGVGTARRQRDTPCLAGDWMYMITTDQEIGAVNVNDAHISWVADLPRWVNPEKKKDPITWFGPVLAGGRLIVLGTSNLMLSLNPMNGEFLLTGTVRRARAVSTRDRRRNDAGGDRRWEADRLALKEPDMPPVVVIAGRPNVGKSTLFNRLAGRRAALVADTPGVTRDSKEAEAMLRGRLVKLVDTAGLRKPRRRRSRAACARAPRLRFATPTWCCS